LAQVEILPAAVDQAPILANLLELYSHDFSEILYVKLGEDGRFGYYPLPLYWREPNRFPFLVKIDENLAGFALVCQGSRISADAEIWDMAEFFIVRGYRRCGAGMTVAHEVWRRFPGRWEVRVVEKNHGALAFWRRAVSEFTGAPTEPVLVEHEGKRSNVFSFSSYSLSDQ
jgi:predicted acetyltransferase